MEVAINFLIKQDKGFSLVEVLIAAAIAGGLALVVAQQYKQIAVSGKQADANTEVNSFVTQVHSIMADKVSCEQTLNTKSIGSPVSAIIKNGISTYTTGQIFNNNFKIIAMKLDSQNGLQGLSIDIKRTSALLSQNTFSKFIPLQLTIDGTTQKVTSCYSDISNILKTMLQSVPVCIISESSCTNMYKLKSTMRINVTQTRTLITVSNHYSNHCGWPQSHSDQDRSCSYVAGTSPCANTGYLECLTKEGDVVTSGPEDYTQPMVYNKCCRDLIEGI